MRIAWTLAASSQRRQCMKRGALRAILFRCKGQCLRHCGCQCAPRPHEQQLLRQMTARPHGGHCSVDVRHCCGLLGGPLTATAPSQMPRCVTSGLHCKRLWPAETATPRRERHLQCIVSVCLAVWRCIAKRHSADMRQGELPFTVAARPTSIHGRALRTRRAKTCDKASLRSQLAPLPFPLRAH